MKHKWLLGVTVGCCLFFAFALWKGWGEWTVRHGTKAKRLIDDPAFKVKVDFILSLMRLNGSRPYTSKEMEILRQFAKSRGTDVKERNLREDAIYVLSLTPDPQQRREAVQLAMEGLDDPFWLVRVMSVRALARLKAKGAVPQILPLLNDPQPEVRAEAKKALQKLGYQVRE